MKTEICSGCGQSHPRGEMFSCFGSVFCEPCANQKLSTVERGSIKPGDVKRLVDPTVCIQCSTDYGSRVLEEVAGVPFCPECAKRARNQPYPPWLRMAAVILAILTAWAFAHSVRYIRARVAMDRAMVQFFQHRDIEGAAQASRQAYDLVPTSPYIQDLYHYFAGVQSVQQDKPEEAISHLNAIKLKMSEKAFAREHFIRQAKVSIAFNRKEYGKMVTMAREQLKEEPDSLAAHLGLAGSCALVYADKGEEAMKQESLQQLELAMKAAAKMDAPDQAAVKYERDRMLHRLNTRQIISRAQYVKQFGPAPGETGTTQQADDVTTGATKQKNTSKEPRS